jgi:hypothetical protein
MIIKFDDLCSEIVVETEAGSRSSYARAVWALLGPLKVKGLFICSI